jgi:glycosyltransferase involved in cell wall biosynthesis
MFNSMWETWKNRKWGYDVIFASSPPLFVAYSGVLLQSFLKKPLVVEIRDIWPDSAVAAEQLEEGIIYRFAQLIEKQVYKRAKAVAAVSKPMAKYISAYRNNDVIVCYNSVKLESILNRRKYSSSYSKNDDTFTIAYTGNIGLCQAVGILVAVGKLIKKEGLENIKIRIIGGGAEKKELQSKVQKDNLGDIIKFEGPYPKDQLDEIVDKEVDILFINLKDHFALRKTIPSKLFDYLLFEKPVIYGIYGEGKEILDSLNIGESFVSDSPESLFKAMQNTIKNYDEYQVRAKKLNLNLLEKKFSREINFGKLAEIISKLITNGASLF